MLSTISFFLGLSTDSNQRNAFFDIDSPQEQIRGQIRTATHFPKPSKNPFRSKFIYKAIDAKAFWTDLNYHTTPSAKSNVNPKKMDFPFG